VPDRRHRDTKQGGGRPGEAPRQAARGAEPVHAAQEKAEVEGGGLNQDPFFGSSSHPRWSERPLPAASRCAKDGTEAIATLRGLTIAGRRHPHGRG